MFTTHATKDKMVNENETVADEVRKGTRRVHRDAAEAAEAIRDDISGTARRIGEHVHDLAASTSENAVETTNLLKEKIGDSPIQSSLIALGVGFVIGCMFRR